MLGNRLRVWQNAAMKVPEAAIAKVVADASAHLGDAKYISGQVDRLMATQPKISQYVIAHQAELSVEGVVTTLFHAAIVHRCIVDATGNTPTTVDYADLDRAATSAPTLEAFAEQEPDLASYVASNLDLEGGEAANAVAGKVLAHVAKALLG